MEVAALTGDELQGDKINKPRRSKTSPRCSKAATRRDFKRNPPFPRKQLWARPILKGQMDRQAEKSRHRAQTYHLITPSLVQLIF